jgi:hypothetical protein
MKKVTFWVDGFERNGRGEVFEGYTNGITWSGFDIPFFTKEVADQLTDFLNNDDATDEAYYDAHEDKYVVRLDNFRGGLNDPEEFGAVTIGGKKYYSIGGFSWTWSIVDEPETDLNLKEFRSHLDKTVTELLDSLDNGDLDERFDLKIEINGKSTAIEMHADLYDAIDGIIQDEIADEEETK